MSEVPSSSSTSRPEAGPVVTSFGAPQESSSKLLALPAELRLKIYEAVLGCYKIHCVSVWDNYGYYECTEPEACQCHRRVNHDVQEPWVLWWEAKHLPPGVRRPSLQLLRACRQIYVEAAHLPYANNAFVLHTIWSLFDMPRHMPAHRVEQITSLSLAFNFGKRSAMPGTIERTWNTPDELSTTDGAWNSAWESLGQRFPCVKELNIWLESLEIENLLRDETIPWVRPLLKARALPLERCRVKFTAYDTTSRPRNEEFVALEKRVESIILRQADV